MPKTKRERQIETSKMTRCDCGNIARYGTDKCGYCHDAIDYPPVDLEAALRDLEGRVEELERKYAN